MSKYPRRDLLKLFTGSAVLAAFPPVIRRALAVPAATRTGTLQDVGHVVILMLENRSFDHYFGTFRGVRGFGDRHPVPLASGKPVWFQSDGEHEITPYRLDSRTTSALRVPDTPHSFADAQAAWNQGKFGLWPKFKSPFSMGHYTREDIPFQFALAEAFTLCDAHHCSVTTGTDPNRIAFFSGSNFDPERRSRGDNCTLDDAEVNNLRCLVKGLSPPGYIYQGSPFTWPTLPELLEQAGVSWRIYQDPNDNWMGLMHGGLAFASFRGAKPGSPLYEKGMSLHTLEDLAKDVRAAMLPQVSWILPPMLWSEHPTPSSPPQGAEFTMRVLEALTSNPKVWGQTVLFLTFDENDGFFDHVPPPAPPSYRADGAPAGGATLDLNGMYFSDPERRTLNPNDTISGPLRPYGLGPRVPLYVISPWSRGGWVNSEVFDHTSVGQFLEKRFGIIVPTISPWHRAVCGDLTSTFDFKTPNDDPFPELPDTKGSARLIASLSGRPVPSPPSAAEAFFQEPGLRRSRALPYELHVDARCEPQEPAIALTFRNTGSAGAVFHVYDRLHLDRIPRRYTVEACKALTDRWLLTETQGRYDLWVLGPNGFVREFRGRSVPEAKDSQFEAELHCEPKNLIVRISIFNQGAHEADLTLRGDPYDPAGPWKLKVRPHSCLTRMWSLVSSYGWYDLTVSAKDFERRFAGRMETGRHSYSDPAV